MFCRLRFDSGLFSGKPAIAVFAGRWKDTYKPLERVIAAPLTPQGLGGGYTQVEAIPRVPHPRQYAAVVKYKSEVWLVGGWDESKLRHGAAQDFREKRQTTKPSHDLFFN